MTLLWTVFLFQTVAFDDGSAKATGVLTLHSGNNPLEYAIHTAELPAKVSSPITIPFTGSEKSGAGPRFQLLHGERSRIAWIADYLPNRSVRYDLAKSELGSAGAPQVRANKSRNGVELGYATSVSWLFAEYHVAVPAKPVLWPIRLGNSEMTRGFPMVTDRADESRDHVHQRSLWFSHGSVNGTNFWAEGPLCGKIVHEKFDRIVSGPVFAEVAATSAWVKPLGEKVCTEARTIRVYATQGIGILDFEIRLKATNGPIKFGDDKEGCFGIRVPDALCVKQPASRKPGTIVNARGDRDQAAWGKRAEWCAYQGEIDARSVEPRKDKVGIAILDAPDNPRHPTYWHVRDYGLFAANPFGVRHFTGDKKADGSLTVPAGESIQFRYRVIFYRGTEKEARIADRYAEFATPNKVTYLAN